MTITRFQELNHYAEKRGKCPVCQTPVTRKRRFWQTLNPWNKNEHGESKSAREIYKELDAEAASWVPDFTHEKCREVAS